MSAQYRLIVHCDENLTDQCVGFAEYASPDRLGIAQATDRHQREGGWLRGYRNKGTWDVCPACRPAVEKRMALVVTKAKTEKPSD